MEPDQELRKVGDLPLAEYRDSTILEMHEGSKLSWRLKTLHMVKWPKSDLIRAEPVGLVVFDSLGDTLVWVTSDSGAVDEPGNFLLAKGRVHGRSRKGMELRTDSLRWNKALDQVTTEARVHVVSEEGDTLTGKGFVSDANLDKWQILSEVRGVFKKVGERTQASDSPSPPNAMPQASPSDSGLQASDSSVSGLKASGDGGLPGTQP